MGSHWPAVSSWSRPPDRHLLAEGSRVRLVLGPTENGHRPSADTLLRSVAEASGPRSAGVVLSGTMDDGAAGLRAIRAVGGLALVQDPDQAAFPSMPRAAIEEASPQVVAPVPDLVAHLCDWLAALPEETLEASMSDPDPIPADPPDLTAMTCPECGGTLWLRDTYGAQRFQCRVGHTFSFDGLMVGKQTALEHALWAAVVALEERADLSRRIMKRLEGTGQGVRLDRYRLDAETAQERADFLQGLIRDLVQEASTTYEETGNSVDATS
jgi:two-component system, chemotaxis family, protein-glutamate methylesterase/glutaminase